MTRDETAPHGVSTVRIPADVDRPDRVLGPLTARQVAILGAGALVVYAGWAATRTVLAPLVFFALALPVVVAVVVLALGQREGISLDRLLLAALRQQLSARLRAPSAGDVPPVPRWLATRTSPQAQDRVSGVHRAPAALRLPVDAVTDTGVLDLGREGLAVVAVASTVNFAVRTPSEQDTLVAAFGAYLHSLAASVQILVRAQRLDLSGPITALREQAGALPHPALQAAALDHAEHLAELAAGDDLLRRQVLLILREPLQPGPAPSRGRRGAGRRHGPELSGARRAAEARLVHRLGEAAELLGPAGIAVSLLDPGQATAVLAAACDPATRVPSTGMAGADQTITTPTSTAAAATPAPDHHGYRTWPADTTPGRGDHPDGPASEDEWSDDVWSDDHGSDGWIDETDDADEDGWVR